MKKLTSTLALMATLLMLSLVGVLFIKTSAADSALLPPLPSTPDKNEPSIVIHSPENNKAYNLNAVLYSITVKKPSSWFDVYPVHGTIMIIDYILDSNQPVEIADEPPYYEQGPFDFKGTLSGLSEGAHSIQVYVRADSFYNQDNRTIGKADDYYLDTYSDWINFTVDTVSPTIHSLSIENKTYDATGVPLNFVVSEATSGITYCLDNGGNVTIVGNTTLKGLSTGAHNVTVYAWDAAGNVGGSQTFNFVTVKNTESQQSEPFRIESVAIATSITFVAVFSVGVIIYFKKRKH